MAAYYAELEEIRRQEELRQQEERRRVRRKEADGVSLCSRGIAQVISVIIA